MHFAISILHVLVLHVLLPSSAAQLQPEPEGECLLQTQAQQAHQLALESDQTIRNPQSLCQAGTQCTCQDPSMTNRPLEPPPALTLTGCQDYCQAFPAFWMQDNPERCTCCTTLRIDTIFGSLTSQVYKVGSNPPGGAQGDPHITTLDGRHYTLLKQGTFELWRLSGLSTEFHSQKGMLKTAPLDWRIFTRYSGQQAFTKGILVVDKSGGSLRQVLEMTSKDCQWRARKADTEWATVNDDEIISLPDDEDYMTGFRITKKGAKGHNHLHFDVNTMGGKVDKAVLSVSCRPRHHINLQLVMKQRSDYQFVEGELKVARGISTLQTDAEFAVDTKWEDLGGSEWAADYFKMDQNEALMQLDAASSRCTTEEEATAQETCTKHLGKIQGVEDQTFYTDCVYDVCHGAGEIAAELAAELLASTRAIEGA